MPQQSPHIYMGKFSMDTKWKTAQDLLPLMQKRHKDLLFEIQEAGTEEDPTVVLCARKPGGGTVATVDMEAFPRGATVKMKADLCNEMIGFMLAEDEDVDFAEITAFWNIPSGLVCIRYVLCIFLLQKTKQTPYIGAILKKNSPFLAFCSPLACYQ